MAQTQQTENNTIVYEHHPNGGSSLTNPYYIGRIKSKVSQTSASSTTHLTEEILTYNSTMLVTQKKIKGLNTDYITENYTHDAFGNIINKAVSAPNVSNRITNYQYDNSGRFLKKTTDIEGLQSQFEYNSFGYLTKETSPYNLIIQYEYDKFGKKTKDINYLGKETNFVYSKTQSVYSQLYINNPDGSRVYQKFDDVGREIITGSYGFSYSWDYIQTSYDIYGRKISVSEPYNGSPSLYNTFEFDSYGRLTRTTQATGKTTNITYNGLTETANDGYRNTSKRGNSLGQVESMTDDGGTIDYLYHANGQLRRTTFNGMITSLNYDGWGRKIFLNDPSAGVYTTEYNNLGETTKEITPKGTTTYILNGVGKIMEKRVQGDFTNLISYYNYNPTTKLIDQITSNQNDSYTYQYDNYKRVNKLTESNSNAFFERTSTYDAYGRSNTERYYAKNNTDNKISDLTIKNIYRNGELHKILNNANQNELWKLNTKNYRGQVTSSTLGNDINELITYDAYGLPTRIRSVKNNNNLINLAYTFNAQRGILVNRTSSIFGSTEQFQHDNLNRLTEFTNTSGNQEIQSYDARGRITQNALGDYNYGSSSKSYQNASIELSVFGKSLYAPSNEQTISYNAFKAPVRIDQGSQKIEFEYNIFQQRKVVKYSSVSSGQPPYNYESKYYSSGGSMEIIHDKDNNQSEFVTYIGGNAYSAPLIYKHNGNTGNFLYLHRGLFREYPCYY